MKKIKPAIQYLDERPITEEMLKDQRFDGSKTDWCKMDEVGQFVQHSKLEPILEAVINYNKAKDFNKK
jgi:hypothetical protein